MAKTALDVTTAAFRRIGVAASDTPLSSEDHAIGLEALTTLFEELNGKEGFTALDDVEAVPDWAFLPVAQMLAVELAPNYGVTKPETDWFQGMRRLRRHAFPDDRDDDADLDEDGTTTAAETEAYERAAFF